MRVGWNSEQDIADRDFTSAPSQQHLAFEANTALHFAAVYTDDGRPRLFFFSKFQ